MHPAASVWFLMSSRRLPAFALAGLALLVPLPASVSAQRLEGGEVLVGGLAGLLIHIGARALGLEPPI